MMCRNWIFLAAVVVTIAGCALKPLPAPEEILNEALPPQTGIPEQWVAAAYSAPVHSGWLQSFNDPTLVALVNEALANNRDLLEAAEAVAIARETIAVVGAQLLPQIGGQLGGKRTYDFGGRDDVKHSFTHTLIALGLNWELDVWGRLRAERAAAAIDYEVAALDYAYARQSLAATVALNWYLVSEAQQLLSLAERAVGIYTRLYDLADFRYQSGKTSQLDVADSRARVESAQANLQSARIAFGRAVRSLEVLLGRYPAAELAAASHYPAVPPVVAADTPIALVSRRPDILAAEYAVLAAFRRQEAARLALRPSFSLSLTAERLGDHLLEQLHLSQDRASAQLGSIIPIYEGGALCAYVRITTAQQAQAVANYGSSLLSAFREVENALESERLLEKRLGFARSSLADRDRAVEIAIDQYQAGKRDLLWVEILQTEQLVAQAEVIKLENQRLANRIQLHLALGGDF